MSTNHKKVHAPTHRTRTTARASCSRSNTRSVPNRDATSPNPVVDGPPPIGGRRSDALAMLGLLVSTLDPSVVMQALTRVIAYGAGAILAVSDHAKRAAELAGQKRRARAVRRASSSRRRRSSSRIASTP